MRYTETQMRCKQCLDGVTDPRLFLNEKLSLVPESTKKRTLNTLLVACLIDLLLATRKNVLQKQRFAVMIRLSKSKPSNPIGLSGGMRRTHGDYDSEDLQQRLIIQNLLINQLGLIAEIQGLFYY
ncbi:hypothetical protein AVEN_162394-1 [Araneus ventricosus]|uniref:Uncharacterized protein n=1 Tax=Araneus ventricosus TaxID=182803 RepID=A0A4Y2GHR1_ARAVE|nr:hypothetical protein AVEN_162394-1 [Araneus ventricosus]